MACQGVKNDWSTLPWLCAQPSTKTPPTKTVESRAASQSKPSPPSGCPNLSMRGTLILLAIGAATRAPLGPLATSAASERGALLAPSEALKLSSAVAIEASFRAQDMRYSLRTTSTTSTTSKACGQQAGQARPVAHRQRDGIEPRGVVSTTIRHEAKKRLRRDKRSKISRACLCSFW